MAAEIADFNAEWPEDLTKISAELTARSGTGQRVVSTGSAAPSGRRGRPRKSKK